MKKIIAIVLCMVMALSMTACTAKPAEEDDGGFAGMPNPWTQYNSLEELNEAFGTNIVHPPVMGVTDEVFQGLAGEYGIAEYKFQVNGTPYTIRSSAAFEDISGVYVGDGTAFQDKDPDDNLVVLDDMKLYRWMDVNGTSVIMVEDGGSMTEEDFVSVCEEIRNLMFLDQTATGYENLPGEYQDSVSMRASMAVTECDEKEGLDVIVMWSNEGDQTTTWEMHVTMDNDARLAYTDCVCTDVGGECVSVIYENGTGYFEMGDDGQLLWTGAQDESCRECVFEKIPG